METTNSELHNDSTEASGEDQNGLGIERTEKQVRQKKLLIALPFIIVPCLVFGFWMIRSGDGESTVEVQTIDNQVNTSLPDPILDKPRNKRESYEQADKEADLRAYNLRRDPYADQLMRQDSLASTNSFERSLTDRTDQLSRKLNAFSDQMSDVEQTDIALGGGPSKVKSSATNRPGSNNRPRATAYDPRVTQMVTEEDKKIAEIESKMAQLNRYGAAPSDASPQPFDSEPLSPEDSLAAVQLQTLDKIMERATMLRFPELAEDEMRKRSLANGEKAYPISQSSASDREVRYFGSATGDENQPPPRGGFYTDQQGDDAFEQITVGAQVHSSVTVVEGSTVKLRLLDDVYVAGLRIPKHSFVYATTSLDGDRLRIQIQTINFRGNIYQVELEGFDLDGLPGIAVPGSVERQIAKREASRTARSVGGTTRTNNLATQLAVEGTDAVKEIASRKLAVTKIYLKSGHEIILRNKG